MAKIETTPLAEGANLTARATVNGVTVAVPFVVAEGATVLVAFGAVDLNVAVRDGDGRPLVVDLIEIDTGAGWNPLGTTADEATVSLQLASKVALRATHGDEIVEAEAIVDSSAPVVLTFDSVKSVVMVVAVAADGSSVEVDEIQLHDGAWRSIATSASSVEVTRVGRRKTPLRAGSVPRPVEAGRLHPQRIVDDGSDRVRACFGDVPSSRHEWAARRRHSHPGLWRYSHVG